MFMIPMPPTSSEIAAIAPRNSVSIWVVWVTLSRMSCWLITLKSGAAVGRQIVQVAQRRD
jgi:hypothetical protein